MGERRNLTDANVADLEVKAKKYEERDAKLPGLCVRVEVSGRKTFYFVYSISGFVRWFRIGPAAMGADNARIEAKKLIGDVARGGDPQAEKRARRGGITFDELADRYREHAKVVNKSWRQADALVNKRLRPYWGKLRVANISRADVKAMMERITPTSPIVANSTLPAASASFKWCIKRQLS